MPRTRQALSRHQFCLPWFTGSSCAGKEGKTHPSSTAVPLGGALCTHTNTPRLRQQTPTPTPAAKRSPLFRAGSPEGDSGMCQKQAPSPAVGNQDFRPYLKGRAEPPSSPLPAETASENSETETYLQWLGSSEQPGRRVVDKRSSNPEARCQ